MKRIIFVIIGVLIGVSSYSQHQDTSVKVNYIRTVKLLREKKNLEFKTDSKSPLAETDKSHFKKLKYFRPKSEYVKRAAITRFENPFVFQMKTTTSRLPEYSLFAEIVFLHHGKPYKLNVYRNIELSKKPEYANYLFIPFNDKTNGKQTYNGGRFLDFTDNHADSVVIDFNNAYNPYCAYNHKYSCPIPPEENNLNIHIKAGEKKFHK